MRPATHILTMSGNGQKTTWRVYKEGNFWRDETDGRSVIRVGAIDGNVFVLSLPKTPAFRLW